MIFLKKQQLKQLKYFLQHAIAVITFAIIKPLPLQITTPLSRLLGRTVVYLVMKYIQKTRFEIFKKNLEIVTKQKATTAQVSKMFRQYCSYVTSVFLTTIHAYKLTNAWLENNVSQFNMQELIDAHKSGEKVIIVSAHFGNWEIAQNYLSKVCNLPLTMLFREQNNIKLSKAFYQNRPNIQMIEKRDKSSLKQMLKALDNNRIIVVLLDQKDGKNGTPIEFFNEKAMLPTAIARIAIKSQAKVFTCKATASNYQISCEKAIDAKLFANETELMKEIFTTFEQWISQNPTNWYCLTHNLWKI